MSDRVVEILYTNWKGNTRLRLIKPDQLTLYFQEGNGFHKEPQWLFNATDVEDGKFKTWAMRGIHSWKDIDMGEHEQRRINEMKAVIKSGVTSALESTFPELTKSQALLDAFCKTPLKRTIITDKEGTPYLERITLKTYDDGSKDYLHIIYKSDDDRDMHDHPWMFHSRIIHGRYINHMKTGSVTYGQGQTLSMRAEDAHRLELLDGPVVTLVHRGPKIRTWGFHTDEGFINHTDYLNQKFGVGQWVKGSDDD